MSRAFPKTLEFFRCLGEGFEREVRRSIDRDAQATQGQRSRGYHMGIFAAVANFSSCWGIKMSAMPLTLRALSKAASASQ